MEWLYQLRVSCACYPARPWAQPPTRCCERRPARSPPGRPRWPSAASASSRCAAVSATARCQYLPLPPGGDPTVTRIFAALVGCFGGLGLSSAWSLVFGHGRGGGTRGPLHARARSDAPPEDGQPIIATGVVRSRPSAHLADRRRRLRRLRLPHVQADGDRQQDERGPGVLGLRRPAVHHRLAVAQLPRRSAPACTPRRRRRWAATPPWRARGSTSDRPAGRRWSTACSARSTPSASGSRTTR